jgi:hyaluronoglucosaminidase
VTVAAGPISGIIEGFYGRPWTWAERTAVADAIAGWGMADYVYAPKDDPKHRERWREPYDDDELAGFAAFAAGSSLRLGFGISPGLSIDGAADADRRALGSKVDQVVDAGARLVVLCLDDIAFGGEPQGIEHGDLTAWLAGHLGDRAALALVPTEYVGIRPSPYLRALARSTPADVPIGWTGDAVVNDAITTMQARRRAEALDDRPPLLWDNVPVNDGLMADRLHLGPLWGRDTDLPGALSGYLANPMVQATASLVPLASIAAWLRGEDAIDAWASEADRRGWRIFAEACDGAVPHALVAMAAETFATGRLRPEDLEPLRAWFGEAAAVEAPGLDADCQGWIDQVRAEAAVALEAVALLEGALADDEGGGGAGVDEVGRTFVLGYRWKALHGAAVSVMGPRLGFRPVLGQAGDGSWAVRRSSIIEGANAVDTLCRLTFDAIAWQAERS